MIHNINMNTNKFKNLILYIPLLILFSISILTMYKCSLLNDIYTNNIYKQIIWFILFIIIILFNKYKNIFIKYAYFYYILNIILLILVLFIGKEINGARAWFKIGFIAFQPSELMKLTYSLSLTKLLYNYKYSNIKNELIIILKIIVLFTIPSILIFLEPDTGAIIFLLIITICMIAISNIKKIWLILLFIIISIIIILFFYLYFYNSDYLINLIGTSFFYRVDRIINIKDNIQINNALIAIGNGYLYGSNNNIYIPEASTDFAYSISINTLGFIGSIIISLCYLIIDIFFIIILFKNNNKTTKLFSSGFISILLFSQFYNMFMNIGLLPIMGIPLPFLSYGGSNLIILGLYISIILNLNKV